jgi:hypothetical protein
MISVAEAQARLDWRRAQWEAEATQRVERGTPPAVARAEPARRSAPPRTPTDPGLGRALDAIDHALRALAEAWDETSSSQRVAVLQKIHTALSIINHAA